MVFHEGGLLSGPFMRVVFYQGLSVGFLCYQGGLSLWWSFIRAFLGGFLCYQDGLSLWWSFIRAFLGGFLCYQGGLSLRWSFIRAFQVSFVFVFNQGDFSFLLFPKT